MKSFLLLLLLLVVFVSFSTTTNAAYNIVDFGAKADGKTDAAAAFRKAWAAACGAAKPAMIYVPVGRFFVSQGLFQGPCKNNAIRVFIDGTLLAPPGYGGGAGMWIKFQYVDGLSIYGGTLDGRGQAMWACKTAKLRCPTAVTSLTISKSKNVLIRGLTSLNSEGFHMSIYGSSGVTVLRAKIFAPDESPNTDGIHIQLSSSVTIVNTTIGTGDDCISMGAGTANVRIQGITCGPGHGISIGSLGGVPGDPGVENITVRSVVLLGTQNGLRIKTWGNPYDGYVRGVVFQHAIMKKVQNPIVIDQNYCPGRVNCPGQSSGIKISNISYADVRGSSATKVAVKFDCSASKPCVGIALQDIKLTYMSSGTPAQSFCNNAKGSICGVINPPSCL
ncbi:polygalacturonase-like [Typha angustifolia]|uniref:polygalacturonase-like n=1 Tax=Typha angustifolia TaxID=59011 RepID=UPI003C2E84FB